MVCLLRLCLNSNCSFLYSDRSCHRFFSKQFASSIGFFLVIFSTSMNYCLFFYLPNPLVFSPVKKPLFSIKKKVFSIIKSHFFKPLILYIYCKQSNCKEVYLRKEAYSIQLQSSILIKIPNMNPIRTNY